MTFYPSGSCLRETKSYVATSDSPLSQTFSDLTLPSNCSANLHLQVDNEGTLVTMMAPWINTTVVIRRLPGDGVLAVTVQVPGRLSFESDGLCRGCPAHSHFSIDQFRLQVSSNADCVSDNNAITFNCFIGFTINDYPEFYSVLNVTYATTCWYSMWRHSSASTDFLGFLRSVGNDAKLLGNRGTVPRRTFEILTPVIAEDSCNPVSETNSSETTETVNMTDSISTTDLDGGSTTDSISTTELDGRSTTDSISTTEHGGTTMSTTDSISTTEHGGTTISTTDSISTTELGGTAMSTTAATTSTADIQRTTSERERPVVSTMDDVEMISSATGHHRRRCVGTILLAVGILSTYGVRLLLR